MKKNLEYKAKNTVNMNDTIHMINNVGLNRKKEKAKSTHRYIISRYIQLMIEAVIRGEQWNLPGNGGSIAVIKETSSVYELKSFKKKYSFNEAGQAFSVKMVSLMNYNLGYIFTWSAYMKRKLDKELLKNSSQFRTQFV